MLLRFPTSLSEARRCLAEGAVPVGGATLVWAQWQRDGFPEQAMSLRRLPEATVVDGETLGAAVLLHQVDDRVPEVLRRAAASVGTGAVRRTATVGGNIVGSTLRCLLPPALVLDARATVLDRDGTYEADLAEVVAKRPLVLDIRWRRPWSAVTTRRPARRAGRRRWWSPPPCTPRRTAGGGCTPPYGTATRSSAPAFPRRRTPAGCSTPWRARPWAACPGRRGTWSGGRWRTSSGAPPPDSGRPPPHSTGQVCTGAFRCM